MFTVSNLWNTLLAESKHFFETRVSIDGVYYYKDTLISLAIKNTMFSEEHPGVGGCLSSGLELEMLAPSATIPRMASVDPFVRVCAGNQTSEWIPQGKFFIDTRETTKNDDGLPVLTIHAFDAMLKAEGDFPSTTQSYPRSDINVVKEIAKAMGLQPNITGTAGIDSRTVSLMTKNYQIGLPVGYSMREVLSYIAAMYAGNWIMSYDGKLLLIPINGIPPETNYLIDSAGDAITFGGDRILV